MDHFILNSEHICWRSVLGSRSALGILNHSSSGRVRRVNSRSWWYLQATASTACIDSALTDFHPLGGTPPVPRSRPGCSCKSSNRS